MKFDYDDSTTVDLVNALHQLAIGQVTVDTTNLNTNFQSTYFPGDIMWKNANADHLMEMPGEANKSCNVNLAKLDTIF